jgi:hypothetical protein
MADRKSPQEVRGNHRREWLELLAWLVCGWPADLGFAFLSRLFIPAGCTLVERAY